MLSLEKERDSRSIQLKLEGIWDSNLGFNAIASYWEIDLRILLLREESYKRILGRWVLLVKQARVDVSGWG